MSGVEFNEEAVATSQAGSTAGPSLAGWLIRSGFAKDERQAQYLLLGVAGIGLLIAAGIFVFNVSGKRPVPYNDPALTTIPGPGGAPAGHVE